MLKPMFANWQPFLPSPEEARVFKYSTEKTIKVPDVTTSSARCFRSCYIDLQIRTILTVVSAESRFTSASVIVNSICTRSSILTGVGGTLVCVYQKDKPLFLWYDNAKI